MRVWRLLTGICIAIAFASGPALAINLSTNGRGQVLLFPYYTVNRGLDTYISIGNSSPTYSVAKVRFLEGRNGRPVADFNLYLPPYDMWTAAVTRSADGNTPVLKTADHSCTTPAIPAEGLAFSTYGFDGSGALPADDGPQDISRTREGSIEVISGGNLLASSPTALAIAPAPGGGPPSCANLPGSLFADVVPPSNSLSGSAAIIDVGAGQYYAYTPDVIANFTYIPLFAATNGPLEPSLAQANNSSGPDDVSTTIAYVFADEVDFSVGIPDSYEFANGIDAVTALFMVDTLSSEYQLEASLGASTDWVLMNPTQRFYVDPVYAIGPAVGAFAMQRNGAAAVFDREGADALPADQEGVALPYNLVNVIGFKSASATTPTASPVLGSQLMTKVISPTAQAGVMRLDIGGHHDIGGRADFFPSIIDVYDGRELFGSSFTGFMVSNVVNSNAQPGLLANYGAASHLRATACWGVQIKPILCVR